MSMSEMYARPGASSPTLPPISRAGGGSFAGGIGGAPSGGGGGGDPSGGGCSIYLGGDGSSMGLFGAFPSASYGGGGGGGKNPGGGGRDDGFGGGGRRPTKVDAAVQTVPSGEQPAMWQEVAAVDAMHQTWSAAAAPPRSRKAAATKGGVGGGISLGGGDSFARSGMKQSYNFSGKRK